MTKTEFTFPVGYYEFNKDKGLNFQLNRYYSMGNATFEDMQEAGPKISSYNDWKTEMLKLAETAVSEGRLMNAAFYYRAAEFYLLRDDPEKEVLYDKFIDNFYNAAKDDEIHKSEVPYSDTFLPAMRIQSADGEKRGTLVLHGGNDSFIEEFYPIIRDFSDHGYEVIAFEGPGQGAALKKYGLPLNIEWEKPTKAVLDYFKLDDVTQYTNFVGQHLARLFMRKFRNFVNKQMKKNMKKKLEYSWFVNNLMYMTNKEVPIEAFDVLMQFNEENLHSDLVQQDVLIFTGREDHLVPFKMHDMQVKALTNARSITSRVFTKEEQAQNHCQMGNLGLALDVMRNWIEQKSAIL
jgi:hypothetical protein